MSSIREVSKVAGVSIATVSRALSHPEKVSSESLSKVHAAIEKVQYRPNMMARNFRSARAYSIVVLVPHIANPFYASVIRGIEDAAQEKGYSVLLGDTRDSLKRERDYLNLVETKQADGVIQFRPFIPGSPLPPKHIAMVNATGCEETPYPSVRIDNAGASKAMVDYLVSLGHRRIGVITGLAENRHTIDRMKGYKQSLEEAGIAFDDSMIAEGDFTMWSGLNASNHFITMKNRPTAIFSMNDEMAIGAIQGLKKAGIEVPDQISITGFDDIEFSKYSAPPLTTIAQPTEEIGRTAMKVLLRLMEGNELLQSEYILPFELVIRSSTSAPNARDQEPLK